MTIRYLEGDATHPVGVGPKIIPHVCNDIGRWGRGFVKALDARWAKPRSAYRMDFQNGLIRLGGVRFVWVDADLVVANMVGQHDVKWQNGVPLVRYEAIRECLRQVRTYALRLQTASIHMPRIGCALAGGQWSCMSPVVAEEMRDLSVTVYDFKDTSSPFYVAAR